MFDIASGKDVTISGLTITNGSAPSDFGGGIYNDHAKLTVSSCTISGNSADQGTGGGIYNDGLDGSARMTITNSTISGNSAWPGGGICNNGIMTITNTTLSGNSDNGYNIGGGITQLRDADDHKQHFERQLGLLRRRHLQLGGAMLTITNNTFSGNFCSTGFNGHGGGILN